MRHEMQARFFERGWLRIAPHPETDAWIAAVRETVRRAVADPANDRWRRYGGTWFVGVNALPNDARGAVPGGPPLPECLLEVIGSLLGLEPIGWDRAQISVCYPGYPQPAAAESAAAHGYRVKRDAAHIDGLLAEGPERRRHLREFHSFILGIPLAPVGPGMSPFSIWEGSHEMMRQAFRTSFAGTPPEQWGNVDVTGIYQAARAQVFAHCRRREITTAAGECYLVHRLALHGMAPWTGPQANPEGRTVLYFRPACGGPREWLDAP